jgi:hypothetical protein
MLVCSSAGATTMLVSVQLLHRVRRRLQAVTTSPKPPSSLLDAHAVDSSCSVASHVVRLEHHAPCSDRDMGPGLVKVPSEAFAVRRNPESTLAGLAHDKGDRSGTESDHQLYSNAGRRVSSTTCARTAFATQTLRHGLRFLSRASANARFANRALHNDNCLQLCKPNTP